LANQKLIPDKIKRDKESRQTAEIIETKEFFEDEERIYRDLFIFIIAYKVKCL
jgi:hypothetical protein